MPALRSFNSTLQNKWDPSSHIVTLVANGNSSTLAAAIDSDDQSTIFNAVSVTIALLSLLFLLVQIAVQWRK